MTAFESGTEGGEWPLADQRSIDYLGIQLNGVDDEMKNCVSYLAQHYKASSLVLKVDCALYRLKNEFGK